MSTFITKLMFQVQIQDTNRIAQFDEQIRVVEASTYEEALEKAMDLGKSEETSFLNVNNQKVTWKFIEVFDLICISELKDGSQVYSTTHEKEDPEVFINYVRQNSVEIRSKSLTFA